MSIEYRSDYFDDPDAKASFERCTKRIFGLDFTRWKDRGLWDDQYRPFSAFVEGVCVASLCVYPSEMSVGGENKQGAQLLTVGTLPEYRSRGIQRELWERAHAGICRECDFVFLFTDDSAAGFYTRLGLRRQPEFSEAVPCPQPARSAKLRFRKLHLEQDADYATIERLARERVMVSDRLGFFNPNLLLFMFLYTYQEWTYFLEDVDAVIVAEETADRLRIHDIVATEMPRLSDVESFLAQFKKEEVEFLFCTDRLGVGPAKKRSVEDSVLFVSDDFGLDGDLVFPSSIRA
ncbi:MAG: GNAT family N-acetyltransferase [bacterium]|nr:GNAT family N-acetyltransferase [bacterium]